MIQQFTKVNVNFSPTNGVFPISSYVTPFTYSTTIINTALPSYIILKYKIFYDADNDNILDPNECSNDSIVYFVTVVDYPLVCKDVNISLDSSCHATITPLTLLTGAGCTSTMKIELSHYGKPISNPIDTQFLGKSA